MSVLLLIIYSAFILLASLAGGWVPLFMRLTHTRMQLATSFVAGLMLGVGLLHLLPHGWQELGSVDLTVWWLLGGFLVMFFTQRFFQFHHHEVPGENKNHSHGSEDDGDSHAALHNHGAHSHCHAGHDHPHEGAVVGVKSLKLTWGGAALGLSVHTLTEGIALAASVRTDAEDHNWLLGFSTFLVIVLHKPFDAMAITTLMTTAGWSRFSRHCVNALFALAFPLGLLIFHFVVLQLGENSHTVVGAALAFAAGTFLCISSSDLLPELQFHSHDRGKLSAALILGLLLAMLIGVFEKTGHDHKHHSKVFSPDAKEFRSIERGG